MTLTPEEVATYRSDLLEFTRYMFKARKGFDMIAANHHKTICDALERVVIGDVKRLIINVPPRAGKTEIAVKNYMAWCMGNFPDCEFIHASYSKRLATTNTWEARAIMQEQAFAEVFGSPQFRQDSNAKDEFRTVQGGIVYATGAEGTITGYGAGKMRETFGGAIVIDDPHKAGEANSDVMRQNVLDWFQTTMESRKNRPDTPIILIMQRLHEDDLSGFLLGGGNGEEWTHVNIPAVTPEGESFWPQQFPLEDLKRKEQANAYVYAGQYLQIPAPIGGGIIKDKWYNYYDLLPPIKWRKIYADTAQKTGTQHDYSVFQCWGDDGNGGKYLIDQVRGKWEAPELMSVARAFWIKQKEADRTKLGQLRSMNVEDKVSGTSLIQTLQRERIPVIPVKRNIDKITRAMDAAPLIQTGNVYLPRPEANPWVKDLLAESTQFPNGKHDDQLDPMFDALVDIDGGFAWSAV